jgi:hypothetical protein
MGLKSYLYKIYDASGNYISTLNDVSNSYPEFSMDINGGVGMLSLDIARSWKDYYASRDLDLYYELRIIVNDIESNAKQVYSGYLNKIKLNKDEQGHEQVSCDFCGYVAEFPFRILQFSTGELALQYNSEKVEDILKDIIDKYAGKVTYSASSIALTGNTVTDVFNNNTIKDCVDKVLTRCPLGWYWYVDGSNIIWLQKTNMDVPTHKLYLGRQVKDVQMDGSMESVYNDIIVIGGTPDGGDQLIRRYQNLSSVNDLGRRTMIKNDGRIYLEATMDYLGKYLLGSNYASSVDIQFDILDSSIDPDYGYDIESIKVGDVIQLKDPHQSNDGSLWDLAKWDVNYWDFDKSQMLSEPIIVEKIRYYGTGCTITASKTVPGVGFRMEDIKRNLDNYLNGDVPIDPTTIDTVYFKYDDNGQLVEVT